MDVIIQLGIIKETGEGSKNADLCHNGQQGDSEQSHPHAHRALTAVHTSFCKSYLYTDENVSMLCILFLLPASLLI